MITREGEVRRSSSLSNLARPCSRKRKGKRRKEGKRREKE
jgi:hypothetical protein